MAVQRRVADFDEEYAATRCSVLDQRTKIVMSAAELFAERGVTATTVRQIAERAGALSGSLYHHFVSKDAIVEEILTSYLAALRIRYRLVLGVSDDPAEQLRSLVAVTLEMAHERPLATTILRGESGVLRTNGRFAAVVEAETDIEQTFRSVLTRGIAAGAFRDDVDPDSSYAFLRAALQCHPRSPAADSPEARERFVTDFCALLVDGLARR